ncbi:MAG: hypothetical protein MRY75_15630 [Marivita sp.]|uniref:hypothetical protein n=1 Tax=Marivita sp. TaxID=2003365 RepID=UPI0025BAC6FE|nr:hypothetical protein [Marivita sp.]MCI5111981.1 hypothetical protein [Marivita sp.]
MPKTYEQLKDKERCIYQAFTKLSYVSDTASNMGRHANTAGFDADDSRAVLCLANHYGLDQCEVMHGSDIESGEAGFDKGKEFIVIITRNHNTQSTVQRVSTGKGLVRGSEARRVLESSPQSVMWHAIYGRTDPISGSMIWLDDQKIEKNGPVGDCCAVVLYR